MNDYTGKTFGRLTALHISGRSKHGGNLIWLCACSCGEKKEIISSSLKNGDTRSCGCLEKEMIKARMTTHGHSTGGTTPTYNSWAGMHSRCSNKKHPQYEDWGGRGITVCERWKSFENFFLDMGERPVEKSLDRRNNDGNYEKSNCRWATRKEQANNRRKRSCWKKPNMKSVHDIDILET